MKVIKYKIRATKFTILKLFHSKKPTSRIPFLLTEYFGSRAGQLFKKSSNDTSLLGEFLYLHQK